MKKSNEFLPLVLHDFNSVQGILKTLLSDINEGHRLNKQDIEDAFSSIAKFSFNLNIISLNGDSITTNCFKSFVYCRNSDELPQYSLFAALLGCASFSTQSCNLIHQDSQLIVLEFENTNVSYLEISKGYSMKGIAAKLLIDIVDKNNLLELKQPGQMHIHLQL